MTELGVPELTLLNSKLIVYSMAPQCIYYCFMYCTHTFIFDTSFYVVFDFCT